MFNFYYKTNDYKALELVVGKVLIYTSYLTPIAIFDPELAKLIIIDEKISVTTSRHRNAIYSRYSWLDESDLNKVTKEEFDSLYKKLFGDIQL
jgi:hypothetical protein